jgi:uncharacterized damage-inducible protein DinB
MNTKDYFLRMFHYDYWANQECVAACRAVAPASAKALRFLAHIGSAEKLWLERLQQVPQSAAVWPDSTVEQCSVLLDEMGSAWKSYLNSLSATDFEKKIDYRNSKGEPWSSRVDDILLHVLMHSAYHRGQVALEMRSAGVQPAYTDFIHGVRQGLVE